MKHLILLLVLLFSTPGFGQVKMSPGSVASTVPWGQITGGITVQSDLISYIYKRAHMICVSDYANIHSAIDVLSTGDILMIDTYAACSKQDTIPADVYLAVRGGKFIDPKTYRLFIRANMLLVGDTKIFRVYSDSSRITITNNDLNPIWFGADRLAGNIDSTTQAFKNMFGSIYYNTGYVNIEDVSYGRVLIPPGIYLLNDVITVNHAVHIEAVINSAMKQMTLRTDPGELTAVSTCRITQTASNCWTMQFVEGAAGFTFWGPEIVGVSFVDGTSDTTANGVKIDSKDHFFVRNCTFNNYQGGYALYLDGSDGGNIWGVIEECVFRNNRYSLTGIGMNNAIDVRNNRFLSLTNSAIKLGNNTGSAWGVNLSGYSTLRGNVWDIQNWSTTGYKWACIFRCGHAAGFIDYDYWDTCSPNGLKLILSEAYYSVGRYMGTVFGSGDTTIHITEGYGILRFENQFSGTIVDENLIDDGTYFDALLNSSGDIYRVYDYHPKVNVLRSGGHVAYPNHFYNPIYIDSTIQMGVATKWYGNESFVYSPQIKLWDDSDTRRVGLNIQYSSSGTGKDTLHVFSVLKNSTTPSIGHDIGNPTEFHSRFWRHYWISGDIAPSDTTQWMYPDFYGTGATESAFGYNYRGVFTLFNDAGSFGSYGGTKNNYIVAKSSTNVPNGAKNGYGALYVSSAGEWTALDSSGNATPFSPHTPGEALPKSESGIDPNEWFFNSTNKDSIQISVNMFKVIEALEQVTGRQFIWKRDLKTGKSLRTFVKE